MTARYQIQIKDQEGAQVDLITDESPEFVSLYCTKLRNTPGSIRLEVDGSVASSFEIDGQIEVKRRALEYGVLEWYNVWEGFHVSERSETLLNGTRRFISEGFTYLDLVRREPLAYKAGTSYVDKSGTGETVIKEYVNENIGPGASSADRLDSSVMPGLVIQTDLERGSDWDGSRAWKTLIETIQEVAEATELAFDIIGTGPATFQFNVYDKRRGEDRSEIGLNPALKVNGAGNPPVVFSLDRNNMQEPALQTTRSDEVNVVYVLGSGEKAARITWSVKDESSIGSSPWNRRAITRNASQENSYAALQSIGEAILNERRSKSVLTFKPMQTHSTVFGRDYFFGDLVTAKYEGVDYHLEIVEVEINVNRDGEELRFRFQ